MPSETDTKPDIECICCQGEGSHPDEDGEPDCGGDYNDEEGFYECAVCDGEGTIPA